MTIDEAREKYKIPLELLREYEKLEFCNMSAEDRQYGDADLARLSTMMTLHELGFSSSEVKAYMALLSAGGDTGKKRAHMLEQKRSVILDEIHLKQKQLDCLDYLRHSIQKEIKKCNTQN